MLNKSAPGKKLSGLVSRQRRQVGCDSRDTRLQMTFFTIVNLANDGVCLYINDFESGLVSPVGEIRDLNKTEPCGGTNSCNCRKLQSSFMFSNYLQWNINVL